jgi:hypothetical protein
MSNLNILLTDYLVFECSLGMVEVVRWVIELGYSGKSNGVQVPHNDCRPLLQGTMPFFSTSFKLELLQHGNVLLAVYDHEFFVLDLIPVLGLQSQEVSLLINWD